MISQKHENLFSGWAWLLIVFFLVVMAIAVGYFTKDTPIVDSSDNNPSVRQSREYTVFYKAGVFGPTNIRIHAGDKVKFQNYDFNPIRIISKGGPRKSELADFDSKTEIGNNGEYSYVFAKAGIFSYYNLNNKDEGGSVIVRP